MIVESHNDIATFDHLSDEWNSLLDPARPEYVFMRSEWHRLWWQCLARGDLNIITIRDDTGQLQGIASWLIERIDDQRVFSPVGCIDVTDYLDLLYPHNRAEVILVALIDYLDSEEAPAWDAIDLCDVLQDSPTLTHLPRLAEAKGWQVKTRVQDVAPVVALPDDFESYLMSLAKKQRHELRRKMRRAQELPGGIDMHIVGEDDDLSKAIEDFFELMAISSPHKAEFLQKEGNRAFLEGVAHLAAEQGWLQLAFLRTGTQNMAVLFSLVHNRRAMLYNSGVNIADFGAVGAGWVLLGYSIQNAIEQGLTHFDFLRGSERYKYQLGGIDTTLYRIVIRRIHN